MKFFIALVAIIVLSVVTQFVTEWWWATVIVTFVVGFLFQLKAFKSFFLGFLGLGLLWGVYAFIQANTNEYLLSEKVANLFSLNNAMLLLLITAILGGILGGFGALSGTLSRQLFSE